MWFRTKLIEITYFISHYGVFETSQEGKTKSLNASTKTASRESFNNWFCSSDQIYETTLCNIYKSSISCIFVFTTNVCAKFIVKLWCIVKTRSIKLVPEKIIHISFTSSKLLHMEITAPLYLIRSPHQFAQDEGQTFPVPAQDFWKVASLLCSFLPLFVLRSSDLESRKHYNTLYF